MNDFWAWWQSIPLRIDPVILSLGNFQLRWYGLMYLVAFIAAYVIIKYRVNREAQGGTVSPEVIERFFTWAILGVLIGGRLGYVLFYNLSYYLRHPIEIILPFSFSGGMQFTGFGGMSYHGGVIGVVVAFILISWKYRLNFFRFSELVIPAIPLGHMFGRIGCFMNGMLYGRTTDVPWGMYFPADPTGQLRHPSPLYEVAFEGAFLFLLLWFLRKRSPFSGFLPGLYLIGYGVIRFLIEFVRQPDSHLGTVWGFLTTGQILSIGMLVAGIILWGLAITHNHAKRLSLSTDSVQRG